MQAYNVSFLSTLKTQYNSL